MTKKIVAVLALSLVASNAFASQAKNIISGTGDGGSILGSNGMNGSFYTNDEYNMFYNPAFINGMKSFAIIENGDNSGNVGTSAGFVTGMGAYNVGVFFNRPGTTNGSKALDLVVGGDMGVKWGVGLTQTMSQTDTIKDNTTRLKAGVMVADFEPFVSYDIKNTNGLDGAAEVKGSDMTIGTRYHFGDWTPYVAYRSSKADTNDADARTRMGLGIGRSTKMGDASVDYSVSYWNDKTGDAKNGSIVPLQMNVAVPAASWFTARAGFTHALRSAGTAYANGTATTLGGSFHMGKADLDMVVGNNTDGEFGIDESMFASAGLTYRM